MLCPDSVLVRLTDLITDEVYRHIPAVSMATYEMYIHEYPNSKECRVVISRTGER